MCRDGPFSWRNQDTGNILLLVCLFEGRKRSSEPSLVGMVEGGKEDWEREGGVRRVLEGAMTRRTSNDASTSNNDAPSPK